MSHKGSRIILGINHMFLYPGSMAGGNEHTRTLTELSEADIDALDCWVWAGNAKTEIPLLKNCGKIINYNIGDRDGEKPAFPAAPDPGEKSHALSVFKRESDFALECGAKKIIFGSGRDVPFDHEGAKERFVEFTAEWAEDLPKDVCLALEPTDWNIDKFALLGKLEDTRECVLRLRELGVNIGILLDMGHIPLMRESLRSATVKTADLLRHIHLGNCIIKDPLDPLYGDKHPCWGAEGGEYDENDGAAFLKCLKEANYFSEDPFPTVSFEMRPLKGMDASQTLERLKSWFYDTAKLLGI